MKALFAIAALIALVGCTERLKEGADREKREEGKINVNGKMVKQPNPGITEPHVLVDGKWVPARLVEMQCKNGQCVPVVKK
jgi:hypothetical protein